MENRRKFYSEGAWCHDTCQQRLGHILWALDANKNGNIDCEELKFMIKNALVSNIYVSKDIVNLYPLSNKTKNLFGNLYNLYKELVNNRKLNFFAQPKGYAFFDICKLADKISSINSRLKRQGKPQVPPIFIEHVVPAEVYLKEVKDCYKNGTLKHDFIKIFNAISICLVTKNEDSGLNTNPQNGNKCLKTNMPEDYKGNPLDFIQFPFARYDKSLNGLGKGIDVYSWTIQNGNIK